MWVSALESWTFGQGGISHTHGSIFAGRGLPMRPTLGVGLSCGPKRMGMRISLCEILISSFPWTMLSHLMGHVQRSCGCGAPVERLWSSCGALWGDCGAAPGEFGPPGLQPGRYELPWISAVSPTLGVGLICGPKRLGIRISLCEILIPSFPWTMLSHLMGQLRSCVELCGAEKCRKWSKSGPTGVPESHMGAPM